MRIDPVHFRIGEWEVRPNLCTAVGDVIPYHAHTHGHLTLIRRGRWRLNGSQELASPALSNDVLGEWVYIEAGERHSFELLELEKGVGALWCLWPEGVR